MNVPRFGGRTYKQALAHEVRKDSFAMRSNGLQGGKWKRINEITTLYKEVAKESLLHSDKFPDLRERMVMKEVTARVNSRGTPEMQAKTKLMERQVSEGVPVSEAVRTLINNK